MSSGFAGLCLLLALAPPCAGQSLGEAAKKERERREKARQAGSAAPTVTDDQLSANKGALANDPNQKAAVSGEKPAARAQEPAGAAPSSEAYWRGTASAARRRVATAERRVLAFQQMIRFGQPGERDENGRVTIYSQQDMKQRADAADAELTAARADLEALLERARKEGALPGWLR